MVTENTPHDPHAPKTGVDQASVERGHELDTFNVKPILMVPVVLGVAALIAYGVVTIVFNSVVSEMKPSGGDQRAEKKYSAPINERLDRTSSTSDKAEVKQPRLEGLKRYKFGDQPVFNRSFLPEEEGNSPEYHPEDMRADRWERLNEYAVEKSKGADGKEVERTRIPIDVAMSALLEMKDSLKVSSKAVDSKKNPSQATPNTANSGRGSLPSTPKEAVK
jgi:hypothetical protein